MQWGCLKVSLPEPGTGSEGLAVRVECMVEADSNRASEVEAINEKILQLLCCVFSLMLGCCSNAQQTHPPSAAVAGITPAHTWLKNIELHFLPCHGRGNASNTSTQRTTHSGREGEREREKGAVNRFKGRAPVARAPAGSGDLRSAHLLRELGLDEAVFNPAGYELSA
ncbi:hypothetical protein E1301_Tti013491 [Triplophysa tibetana]|uniref:Uncharacterized protein n=1 Tax=Triplophysa tibetana TaxID=1572043 RepID=A0A5A9NSA8_9TELE|nr:hypothetical protein E1301_Tti013491 [Triplophysa tibetana]